MPVGRVDGASGEENLREQEMLGGKDTSSTELEEAMRTQTKPAAMVLHPQSQSCG